MTDEAAAPPRVERVIRFPGPLYGRLKAEAERNRRSANAELLVALENHLDNQRKARNE